MSTVILVVLVLVLIGVLPAWPYSREWGYYPSGLVSTLLIVIMFLFFTGSCEPIHNSITAIGHFAQHEFKWCMKRFNTGLMPH
jgi:Protein of unknown function (DUF3309)